jgi:hypothetical protein
MNSSKNILLDKAMQGEPHGIGIMPETPTLISPDELAQRERDYALQEALGSVQTMKEFWQSGDRVKMAFAMKFCSTVQEWFMYLYNDSDFLSFGSDENFVSPEPDYDNEARRLDDAAIETMAWEVCNA